MNLIAFPDHFPDIILWEVNQNFATEEIRCTNQSVIEGKLKISPQAPSSAASAGRWTVKQHGQWAASPPECWNIFSRKSFFLIIHSNIFHSARQSLGLLINQPRCLQESFCGFTPFLVFAWDFHSQRVFAFSMFTSGYLQSGSNRGKLWTVFNILVWNVLSCMMICILI